MASRFWTLAGSGNWDVATNWTGNIVPGSPSNTGDVAFLAHTATIASYTVTILAADFLTLSGLSVGTAGGSTISLVDNGTLTVTGQFFVQSASVTIAHSATIGELELNGLAALTISSGATLVTTSQFNDNGGNDNITEQSGSTFFGSSGSFGNSLTWSLSGASTAGFTGQIAGSGITFSFSDATADRLNFGDQGNQFGGSITNFQLNNVIDLQKITFQAGLHGVVSGTSLIIENAANQPQITFANFTFSSGLGTRDLHFSNDGSGGTLLMVCFAAGTRIETEQGEIAVEALRIGDQVLTLDGDQRAFRPVRWIGRRRLRLRAHPEPRLAAPIRIGAGAFDANVPHRDLVVSPDHAIHVGGALIPARLLVNHLSIVQEMDRRSVEYFHVELDRHSILLAEGLETESYLDSGNRGFFSNSGAPLILHPDLSGDGSAYNAAEPCVKLVTDETSVLPVWQRLHDRAVASGLAARPAATTPNADLRVVAGGRMFRPIPAEDGRCFVALPGGTNSARLVSRHAAPADTNPWLDDRRRLGVAVERILLTSGDDVEEIPVDHPSLSRGWWDAERRGTRLQRWTDGDATIPLPGGPVLLELVIVGTVSYVLPAAEAEELKIA